MAKKQDTEQTVTGEVVAPTETTGTLAQSEQQAPAPKEAQEPKEPEVKVNPNSVGEIRKRALVQVRFKLVCNNTSKMQQKTTLVTVGNDVIGTYTKAIPLSPEYYINGYHAPEIIVAALEQKTYSVKNAVVDKKTGNTKELRLMEVPEYTITRLPPLTEAELKELAEKQKLNNSLAAD